LGQSRDAVEAAELGIAAANSTEFGPTAAP